MKFKELANMSKEERESKMKELELELIKLNAQVATGTPPKNAGQIRRVKKDLARMMLLKSTDQKIGLKAKKQEVKPKPAPKPALKPELKPEPKPQAKSQSNDSLDKTNKQKTKEETIEKTK